MNQGLRLTDVSGARDAGFVERVKVDLGLTKDARLDLQSANQTAQGERVIVYASSQMRLEGAEFGVADGVAVDEPATASLKLDSSGNLISSQIAPIDDRHLRAVKDQVRKLAAADEIYLAAPGQVMDVNALRAQRKPWYVETDAQGRKRLKRAYVS